MGVLEPREREKQELRQQIFDTARARFAAEGYEAVTTRKIADAIEHSPTGDLPLLQGQERTHQ
jgi:hypothetical protein